MSTKLTKKDSRELTTPNNVTDLYYSGKEVIFPTLQKQALYCKLRIDGFSKTEIMEKCEISEEVYRSYNERFKPFVLMHISNKRDIIKAEDLLIIRQRINQKLKEVETKPELDTTNLHDWLSLDAKFLEEKSASSKTPQGNVINIIDNRVKQDNMKTIEADVKDK